MNHIKERRRELGMQQKDLAEILREIDPRIDTGMVSRFEQELCFPNEALLQGIEKALGVDRSELYEALELVIVPSSEAEDDPIADLVAHYIPFGRENAIRRDELAARMGMTDRNMRRTISRAKRKGLVIINDQGGDGYYRSEDLKDLRRQLRQTHSRALSILAQEKSLKERIRALEGEQ